MPEFKFTLKSDGVWDYLSDIPLDPRSAILLLSTLRKEVDFHNRDDSLKSTKIPSPNVQKPKLDQEVSMETFHTILKREPSLKSKIRLNNERIIEVYCEKHGTWKSLSSITNSDCTSCNEAKILSDIKSLMVHG